MACADPQDGTRHFLTQLCGRANVFAVELVCVLSAQIQCFSPPHLKINWRKTNIDCPSHIHNLDLYFVTQPDMPSTNWPSH